MEFNSFVFPVPSVSYSPKDFPEHLLYIPKKAFSYKDKIKYAPHCMDCKTQLRKRKITKNKLNGKVVYHNKSNSMINKIPSVTFTIDNKFEEKKNDSNLENISYIPCLFYKVQESDKIMIYFHSNYEDIGNSSSLISLISKILKINVLAVEYPGYGIYHSQDQANAERIENDAETVFKFINEILGIPETNIIIMGRCVGSGPATLLATKHEVLCLILLSPFKSIKEAVKTMFPKLNFGNIFATFVKERFNNYENIAKVNSPILFIHGKHDNLIPNSHSIDLINNTKSPSKLVSPANMTHNCFDYIADVIMHIKNFLKVFTNAESEGKIDDTDEHVDEEKFKVDFPEFMFKYPYI